jgi:phosphoglycolate phosphatase
MMSRQFELIVFDWDGTLMDSTARIVASLQAAGDEIGLSSLPESSLRNVIGLGMREAIHMLYPDLDDEQARYFTDRYRHHFMVACPMPEKLFDNVHGILNSLVQKELFLAIATGKSRRGLNRALDETGCGHFFHSTRCADETCSKPDPQMLIEIIEELGVNPLIL